MFYLAVRSNEIYEMYGWVEEICREEEEGIESAALVFVPQRKKAKLSRAPFHAYAKNKFKV